MKKRHLIPPLPEPFVLTEELEANLKEWIEYLKNMSPRVRVISIYDEKFDPDYFKDKFKEYFDVDDNISNIEIPETSWPHNRQIAFIAFFDSALPGERKGITRPKTPSSSATTILPSESAILSRATLMRASLFMS